MVSTTSYGSVHGDMNVIKLFKNKNYIGNSVQRFYNTIASVYYGWELTNHEDDQMSYFKVSVLPSEMRLFFKSIISLNGSCYMFRQVNLLYYFNNIFRDYFLVS